MPASRSIFAMRLLVLAAIAAVAVADVSELTGIRSPIATSYGVPQNSVTENFLNAVPTSPSPGLNLPALEHQDFNAQISLSNPSLSFVSSTPAPSLSSIVSTTSAPSIVGGLGFGSGYSYTTPAPDVNGNAGLQNFVSSTPAPNVVLTSGSQELLSPQIPNFNFGVFPTSAPSIYSTQAPIVSTTAAPIFNSGIGSGLNFPSFNFGLDAYSTPLPYLGGGGLSAFNAGYNVHGVQGVTSGGSLNDAFGVSSGPVISVPNEHSQITKHVYFYDAPDDPEPPRTRINVLPVPPPKKNVKIIFIKAPAPPAPAPIRIAAPPQNEEKTLVYVLVKKPEDQQDIEIQPPVPTEPSKPEVYFIRYKNHQEAEQAISQVQSGQSTSAPQLIADTVNGGDIITSINKESIVTPTPFPILNYFQSTTTVAPPVNLISGPIVGPGFDTGFNLQLENDINNNLIPSDVQTSSVFSTVAPVTVSSSDIGIISTSTASPHVTYGPPIFKKK